MNGEPHPDGSEVPPARPWGGQVPPPLPPDVHALPDVPPPPDVPAPAGAPPVYGAPLHASPEDVQFAPGEPERWYLPDWGETIKLLGWRVVLFIPALGLVLLVLAMPLRPWAVLQWLLNWWRVWVFAVVVPTLIAIDRVKNAIRSRPDPFCIHCGYGLTGLPPEHTCPECGARYTPALIEEYKRDPHWFIQRYRANRKIAQ